jgi:hypothetical protein
MSRPTIGVVIATPGRKSLYDTLLSIAYQGLEVGDDILIVGDGHHQPTADLVKAFGEPFRYVATRATRTWGHDQQNHGLKLVKGDVLVLQDDDDIFAPRAFDEIRRLAARFPGQAFLGRVKTPFLGLLWDKASPEATLDGHCVVVPNDKEKLGYFTREYAGDQAWIKSSLEKYDEVYWADRVWSITRPTWKLRPFRLTASLAARWADPHVRNFGSEITERLDVEGRLFQSNTDCSWLFFQNGHQFPVAMVWMIQDEERWKAAVSFQPGCEHVLVEIAEFLAFAGQGLPVWLYVKKDDYEVIEAVTQRQFDLHWQNETKAEYIHEWPPRWFEEKKEEPAKKLIVDP